MPPRETKIVFLTNLLRIGRFMADQLQARNSATFLIDRNDRLGFGKISKIVNQLAKLRCRPDVPPEKNKAAWPDLAENAGRFWIQFISRQANKQNLTQAVSFHNLPRMLPVSGRGTTFFLPRLHLRAA